MNNFKSLSTFALTLSLLVGSIVQAAPNPDIVLKDGDSTRVTKMGFRTITVVCVSKDTEYEGYSDNRDGGFGTSHELKPGEYTLIGSLVKNDYVSCSSSNGGNRGSEEIPGVQTHQSWECVSSDGFNNIAQSSCTCDAAFSKAVDACNPIGGRYDGTSCVQKIQCHKIIGGYLTCGNEFYVGCASR